MYSLTRNAMTVNELRELLEDFPGDMPVVFAHPSHDYWRRELAGPVTNAEFGNVKWSEYHDQWATIDESDRDDDDIPLDDDPEVSRAVVIR